MTGANPDDGPLRAEDEDIHLSPKAALRVIHRLKQEPSTAVSENRRIVFFHEWKRLVESTHFDTNSIIQLPRQMLAPVQPPQPHRERRSLHRRHPNVRSRPSRRSRLKRHPPPSSVS